MADYLVDTQCPATRVSHRQSPESRGPSVPQDPYSGRADLCVMKQNLVEFWGVCTRPEKDNGLGKSVAATDRYCRFMESFLTILPKTPAIFTEWRSLVVAYQVSGKKVHDARIVAAPTGSSVPQSAVSVLRDIDRQH